MNSHLNKGIDDWLTASLDWLVKGLIRLAHAPRPVSYTHLTLPTILLV